MRTLQFILLCLVVGFFRMRVTPNAHLPGPRTAAHGSQRCGSSKSSASNAERPPPPQPEAGSSFPESPTEHRISGDLFYRCNPVHF